MKIKQKLAILLGAIAILSVSCNSNINSTADNPEKTASEQSDNQAQQDIKVSGAATGYPALQALASAYEAKENVKIDFQPPSQTTGAIAGSKNGLVDLGPVTRELKPEENDGSVDYREIVRDGLLVATHPSVKGVTNLQTEQLKAIYSGAATNWQEFGGPDAKIVVLDRPEDESAKRLLRESYLGKDLKNAPDAVILRHEEDLVEAVQNTPYSIGAFSLAEAIAKQLPVNRLSLNGVEPSLENVEADKYTMVRRLGIVYRKSPSETAQKFIDFIFSEEGANSLRQAGFVPSSKN